jgi:hypothetical protein
VLSVANVLAPVGYVLGPVPAVLTPVPDVFASIPEIFDSVAGVVDDDLVAVLCASRGAKQQNCRSGEDHRSQSKHLASFIRVV